MIGPTKGSPEPVRGCMAWPGLLHSPDGVPGVVPFAALFRASSCRAFPRRATHLPLSRTRPPREFCPGEQPSRSIKGSEVRRLFTGLGLGFWAFPTPSCTRRSASAGPLLPWAFPLPGFRTGGSARLSSSVFSCTGRVSSPGPVVGLWVPLPVASAHELGPWRGGSAACCRGQRLDQSGSR